MDIEQEEKKGPPVFQDILAESILAINRVTEATDRPSENVVL